MHVLKYFYPVLSIPFPWHPRGLFEGVTYRYPDLWHPL